MCIAQRAARSRGCNGRKVHAVSGVQLRQAPCVGDQRRADFGVTADGLVVVQQHDRLSIRRYLNGAQANSLGQHTVDITVYRVALQAVAHAVAAFGHAVGEGEKLPLLLAAEQVLLVARYHAQRGLALIAWPVLPRQRQPPALRNLRAGQAVAFGQRLAVQAARALANDRGRATEIVWYVEALRHAQVAPAAVLRIAERDALPGLQLMHTPERMLCAVDGQRHTGPGDAEPGVDFSL